MCKWYHSRVVPLFFTQESWPFELFFGCAGLHHRSGLFLSQSKYIADLLHDTNMVGIDGVATPMSSSASFFENLDSPVDEHNYRCIIGKLQYLSFIHPDIMYVVNHLSQFMHKPMDVHWRAVKRLPRYLNRTCNHSLHISCTKDAKLVFYSDSD